MYPVQTGVGRGRGTLAPGTPVPPRAGTVFPYSDRPPRFPPGGAPAPHGGRGTIPSASTPAPRRRGACSFCGHLGHWAWECPAQSPEVRAHGRALCDAVAAHPSGRGPRHPRPCLWARARPSRLRRRARPPPGALRRAPPCSSTPWKPTTGPTRTSQPTTTGTPPRSGQPGTVTAGTPGTPREARKGQPLQWSAHGRRPPQGKPTLLHYGEPPAPGPQVAGRSGVSASACLLPAGLGAAGGGPPRIVRGPEPGPGPGTLRGWSGPLPDATGCRVGPGPGPLRPSAVVRWGWRSGRSPRLRGARGRRAPAPPRGPRPPRAYPLPVPRGHRGGFHAFAGCPDGGGAVAAFHPAQLPHRGLVGPGKDAPGRSRCPRGHLGGAQPGPPKRPCP